MIVVVAPGQGSQTPGFLAPWVAEPAFREQLERLSDAAGVDLVAAGTTGDADAIRATEVAQPLIVAASLTAFGGLDAERVQAVAGHSVGEVTAAVAAGILDEQSGMRFVAARGRAMAEAAAAESTGMSAVLGGDEDALLARFAELGLEPANRNGAGQIVAAGTLSALEVLSAEPPRGTRVIPLQVAGAFHTRFMRPAVAPLTALAETLAPAAPRRRIWTNHDGTEVTDGPRYLDLLVGQVASPVRWDACMQAFQQAGVTGIIELAPAGTLVGLARRALKGTPTVAVRTPDDLAAANELLGSLA